MGQGQNIPEMKANLIRRKQCIISRSQGSEIIEDRLETQFFRRQQELSTRKTLGSYVKDLGSCYSKCEFFVHRPSLHCREMTSSIRI